MANEDDMDFSKIEDESESDLSPSDFTGGLWVKNPEVGKEIVFTVEKVIDNKNIKGKNSVSGAEFTIGIKQKDGKVRRYDIHTDIGVWTVPNWELYFKLFSNMPAKPGLLMKYAKEHKDSFKGAKVSIKKLIDGSHMSTNLDLLAKALGMSIEDARKYQEGIKLAVKEQRLYEVKLI